MKRIPTLLLAVVVFLMMIPVGTMSEGGGRDTVVVADWLETSSFEPDVTMMCMMVHTNIVSLTASMTMHATT